MSNKSESVRVCVRIRPINNKEKQDGHSYAVFADKANATISLKDPNANDRESMKNFTFDATFPPECTQMDVYNGAATTIVEAVLDGFNGTIFAYGQTGAGKSHTMEGYNDPADLRGIIPNSFKHIFDKVNISENKKFLVRCSYLEIYNEEVRDLLSKDPKNRLELKENIDSGVYVKDLTCIAVKDAQEMDHVMQAGKKNRSVGSTLMNQTSSRSHSMFTIVVECYGEGLDGEGHVCMGKLNLVDLAGSERQSKTGATGDRLKEATKINLSLSALGNVIKALVDSKSNHIPYRDSKLTRLLQNSLGGNAKTVMIANCGPADYNYDETLSTLRYANRAKNIKNKPKINEDPKDAMLREYQEEIERLKEALRAQGKDGPGSVEMMDGKAVARRSAKPEIVEKIVEKVVVKREGLSEEELKKLEDQARKEKEELRRKAQKEMKSLLERQSRTEEERATLEQQLLEKAEAKETLEKDRQSMLSQLSSMEEKLIVGGKIMDKAAKQEAELRETQRNLEEQHHQEMLLARELAEKDEGNVMLEEQYTSLQDEVDIKTKKLKKLWNKHTSISAELNDVKEEFSQERDDMLNTIRELQHQLSLKQFIRQHFIPTEVYEKVKKRATWDDDKGDWTLNRINLTDPSTRLRRPVSDESLRRPETDYARHRKQFDSNPRYKIDNIIDLQLDQPERFTEDDLDETADRVHLKLLALVSREAVEVELEGPRPVFRKAESKNQEPDGVQESRSKKKRREKKNNYNN